MSKWKHEPITILQIVIQGGSTVIGLGDDSRIYIWDEEAGKWKKGWDISNE